ncbi:HAD hydrolase family protein [Paenibacillus sp. NFR01]|uniref:HAD hydrolase family protein n=1 Tax=Paenibacillus sp. NFR01 TaxID=1566279 RepID=UPI000B827614
MYKKGAENADQGHRIRSRRDAVNFVGADLASLGIVVCYNGALYHCPAADMTFHHPIPAPRAAEIIDFCMELEGEAKVSIEVMDRWYARYPLDEGEKLHFKTDPEVIPLLQMKAMDCTKVLVSGFGFPDKVTTRFGSVCNVIVTDGGSLIQIMSSSASKEAAVAQLCAGLGIEMEQVMCFGDDHNDLGMFQACGYPVAMGNAVPLLKDIAAEITETNDNDGVALILEKIIATK